MFDQYTFDSTPSGNVVQLIILCHLVKMTVDRMSRLKGYCSQPSPNLAPISSIDSNFTDLDISTNKCYH
jgi:hypothetical protein